MATPKSILHIDAVHSATPGRVTEPGQARRISVAALATPLRDVALQSHFRMVLYYEKDGEESASAVGAWIKESLSVALPDQPLLAGRLRRDKEGDGYWEIKLNDAGVRLVQASVDMSMEEFLGSRDKDKREAQLAHWVDVDKGSSHFSALFYVQVTQFRCHGYSLGISCSLLLADPLLLTRFLKSWAQTKSVVLAQGLLAETHIFQLSHIRRPGSHLRSISLDSSPTNFTAAATMLFKVTRSQALAYDTLAALCLDEATRRLEGKATANFLLILHDHHSGDLKVQSCTRYGLAGPKGDFDGATNVAWWDELGVEEIALCEGNRAVQVSCRVVSSADEGLVVVTVLPPGDEGASEVMISATVPK